MLFMIVVFNILLRGIVINLYNERHSHRRRTAYRTKMMVLFTPLSSDLSVLVVHLGDTVPAGLAVVGAGRFWSGTFAARASAGEVW